MTTSSEAKETSLGSIIEQKWQERFQGARGLPVPPPPVADVLPEARGRTGAVHEEFRQGVRDFVEGLNPTTQFVVEASPSMLGTIIGARLFGIKGASVLGGFGEFIGQELGITPKSIPGLVLSAAGPGAGKLAGEAVKLGRKGVGKAIVGMPPAKVAMAQNILRKAAAELDGMATKLLSQGRGLARISSEKLYEGVRRLGGSVDFRRLVNTNIAMGQLRKQTLRLQHLPDGKALLKLIDGTRQTLRDAGQQISFDTLMETQKLLGAAVGKLQSNAGVKFGGAKALFKALQDDLDVIAKSASKGKPGQAGARLVKAATKRSRLQFAVTKFEGAVARFTKPVQGKADVEVEIDGLRKWFLDVTNPRHAKFDQRFVDSLKDEIPHIGQTLRQMSRFGSPGASAAGPRSIIIRNIGARTGSAVVGGLIGFGTAGPIGGGLGAMAGASIPERLTAMLTSKKGAAFLARAVQMGQGSIHETAWVMGGQLLAQMLSSGTNRVVNSPTLSEQ
jgi:hypothetical protein